jgi:hypothetical protein
MNRIGRRGVDIRRCLTAAARAILSRETRVHLTSEVFAPDPSRCAKTGNTSLDALTEAGERALAQLPQGSRRSAKLKGADIRPNWQNAA